MASEDLTDTRVLIPRVRRAIYGGSGASATVGEMTDEEVNALVADAIADLILYSGGKEVLGIGLEVADRDDDYLAPIAWRTEEELSESQASLIAAQAALTQYMREAENLKTKERIADEGQEWQYEIAASVVTSRIKALREDRDRALDLLRQQNVVTDAYINFLGERDAYTTRLIEPWSVNAAVGGQFADPRGF